MDTSELDYLLPPELIAQQPLAVRDSSRLLVYERASGSTRRRSFSDLPESCRTARSSSSTTRGSSPVACASGGRVAAKRRCCCSSAETGRVSGRRWPARRGASGRACGSPGGGELELLESLGEGRWLVRLGGEPDGDTPLPPYIRAPLDDPDRYQTVYADEAGSAAAPTAGLHFTPELLGRLPSVERITLHVGLDTFRPVTSRTVEEHPIHGERYRVEPDAWERIQAAACVVAVGTTTVRVLETLARGAPLTGRTDLFVTPGFEFRRVDCLVTNFHLPRTSLLALVMAFAGVEQTRELYRLAIAERYRFYSFGDAMVIL